MSESFDAESLEDWLEYALAIHSAAVKIEGHEPLVSECNCEIHFKIQMLRPGNRRAIEQQFGLGESSGTRARFGRGKAHRDWIFKASEPGIVALAD